MLRRLPPLALSLLLLGGCVLDGGPVVATTLTSTAPHLVGSAVDLEARNGAITLTAGGPGAAVGITADFRCAGGSPEEAARRADEARFTAERDGDGTLVVRGHCGLGDRDRDGLALTVVLPEAVGARLATSNGPVEVRGTTGALRVTTSNAGIRVETHRGGVEALTSNGTIHLEEVTGPVVAESSNGALLVRLTPQGMGPVNLVTSNGEVVLRAGPGFAGRVQLATSNGRLVLEDPGGRAASRSLGDTEGVVWVGTEGPDSSLVTSNAAIRLVLSP